MRNKILVSDSKFLECVDEIATKITLMKFESDAWAEKDIHWTEVGTFTDEAQDFYNDNFDEIETIINDTLNVWNKQTI